MADIGPQMKKALERYGLGSLAAWLSKQITDGKSADEIELALFDRPEFVKRFPAIKQREKAGLPPVSVEEYLAYENFASQVGKSFGVTLTADEVNGLLAKNVSTNELQVRLGYAAKAVYQAPVETRAELQRLYGISHGDLVRYWLDPKVEAPKLERRFVSAAISGAATRAGFGSELSAGQAEGLYEAGLDEAAASEGFAQLVEREELFEATDRTESDIGVVDQLELLTGDARVGTEVARRGEKRVAYFEEGGGFSSGREGITGVGSAAR